MTQAYQIRQGGLFRCCLASLDGRLAEMETEPPIGTVFACIYCKSSVVRTADGVWEWNQPRTSAAEGKTYGAPQK